MVGNFQISLAESCRWHLKACGADIIFSDSLGVFADDVAKAGVSLFDAMQQSIWEVLTFNS